MNLNPLSKSKIPFKDTLHQGEKGMLDFTFWKLHRQKFIQVLRNIKDADTPCLWKNIF